MLGHRAHPGGGGVKAVDGNADVSDAIEDEAQRGGGLRGDVGSSCFRPAVVNCGSIAMRPVNGCDAG